MIHFYNVMSIGDTAGRSDNQRFLDEDLRGRDSHLLTQTLNSGLFPYLALHQQGLSVCETCKRSNSNIVTGTAPVLACLCHPS